MAIPTTPVRSATKVRTPRPPREVVDTVEVLFAKVLEVANQFQKESDQARARKWGQSIVELQSGDTQPNRRAMRFLLKQAHNWVADEAAQAAKKAQALAETEALVAPVRAEWANALNAWVEKSRAYGQLAVARKFFSDFVRVEGLVKNVKADPEAVKVLVAEIAGITAEVRFFVWTDPTDDVVAEAKPQKRRVAKPGSASKRHKGGAKRVKGELSPKDKAKNAELLIEAQESAHAGKPGIKGPAREKKAATKTKTKKGLGT